MSYSVRIIERPDHAPIIRESVDDVIIGEELPWSAFEDLKSLGVGGEAHYVNKDFPGMTLCVTRLTED